MKDYIIKTEDLGFVYTEETGEEILPAKEIPHLDEDVPCRTSSVKRTNTRKDGQQNEQGYAYALRKALCGNG